MASVSANASISITANGTSRVNGTLSWTKPTLPSDAVIESVNVSASLYTWGGKGTFTITINGHQITSGSSFDVALPITVTSPYTITGVGGNKNATGNNCSFQNLQVTYTYSVPVKEQLKIKDNGIWKNVSKVYKKINGSWVEQTDLSSVFDTNTNYIKSE